MSQKKWWTLRYGYIMADGEPYTGTCITLARTAEEAIAKLKKNKPIATYIAKPLEGRLCNEVEWI